MGITSGVVNEKIDYTYPAARADEDEVDASSGACIIKGTMHIKITHDVVCHPHNVTRPHGQLHGVGSRTAVRPRCMAMH